MLKTIEGVYRNGKIELLEALADVTEEMRVIITFLPTSGHRVDLQTRGIDAVQAADLRARLQTFVEDWESTEMDKYDDYDTAHAAL